MVALDHYECCTRLVEQQAYYRRTRETGEVYGAPHLNPYTHVLTLPSL